MTKRHPGRVILAFLLLVPSVLFVTANVLAYELGVEAAMPLATALAPRSTVAAVLMNGAIVLGPLGALALTVPTLLRVRLRRDDGSITGAVTLRLAPGHLAAALVALFALSAIAAYLVVENLL